MNVEKDISFLNEMSVRLEKAKTDSTEFDYLKTMINDWKDELHNLKKQAESKQLNMHDVSMRSEQLKAFNKWFQENAPLYDYGIDETVIEDYLKSL